MRFPLLTDEFCLNVSAQRAQKPINTVASRTLAYESSVLIVDDEVALREQMCAWADALGYQTRDAADARNALAALDEQVSDIAICDVELGGGRRNGVWLAEQIRDRFPDTAVIMATAGRDVEIAVASLRNQVVDYLLKPFDERRLSRRWPSDAAGTTPPWPRRDCTTRCRIGCAPGAPRWRRRSPKHRTRRSRRSKG